MMINPFTRFEAAYIPKEKTRILKKYRCPLKFIRRYLPELSDFLFRHGIFTRVKVPKRFNCIGVGAFEACKHIREIILPDTVEALQSGAFADCIRLEKIRLPERLTEIPARAFFRCSSLRQISLPQGLTEIGRNAFRETGLTEITFPANTSILGEEAFEQCADLEKIVFSPGILELDYYTFYKCEKLKNLVFPPGLQKIGYSVFQQCTALEEVTLPGHIRFVANSAFEKCGLKRMILPDSLTGCGAVTVYGDDFSTALLADIRNMRIGRENPLVWEPLLLKMAACPRFEVSFTNWCRMFFRQNAGHLDAWVDDALTDENFADVLDDAELVSFLLEAAAGKKMHRAVAVLMDRKHKLAGEVSLDVTGDDLL